MTKTLSPQNHPQPEPISFPSLPSSQRPSYQKQHQGTSNGSTLSASWPPPSPSGTTGPNGRRSTGASVGLLPSRGQQSSWSGSFHPFGHTAPKSARSAHLWPRFPQSLAGHG